MPEPVDRDDLPQATVSRPRRTKISVVWIIPILAAVIGLGIAIQRLMTEGPTITIVFRNAEGIEAGKTFVKYKDVNIGHVSSVVLTDGYGKVEVTAKITKSAAGLMVEDAKFWVVSPRITLSGISGLGTLLSGNYIGLQPGQSTRSQRHFTGLDEAPVSTGQPGKAFHLKASDLGSLGIGAPVYYRRLQAGQVIKYDLAPDGKNIDITVFVNAPYDKYVTPETRFWNASGLDVTLGAGGVDVRTEGLVALLAGGLAFDTPPYLSAGAPATANTSFSLHRDRAEAMKQPDTISRRYVLYFNETVRGLSVGAPVLLFGLPAGEVVDVGLSVDMVTGSMRPRVIITFFPERLVERVTPAGQQAAFKALVESDAHTRLAFVKREVEERGLRAQLRSGNLITGQLFVAVDRFPDAPRAKVDWSKDPLDLPVVASTVPDLEAKLTSILAKLDSLPLDAIGKELESTVTSASKLMAYVDATLVPELKDTVDSANRLLGAVDHQLGMTLDESRRVLASADRVLKNTDTTLVGTDAPAQQELRDALQEIVRAARAVRVLADYLERHPESLIRGKNGAE
jgi:paraquat-inducible protein B